MTRAKRCGLDEWRELDGLLRRWARAHKRKPDAFRAGLKSRSVMVGVLEKKTSR